jgi:hypothetical protein
MRKLFIVAALVVVGAAVTPVESQAGCGLLSRLFGGGRGGCGSSSVVRGGGCASGNCGQGVTVVPASASVPQAVEITRPAFIPTVCPDGKCGNCSAGVLQTGPSRFRLFR